MKEIIDLVHLRESTSFIRSTFLHTAKTAIVLGTGLGSIEQDFEIISSLKYNEIPHMPSSTTESHKGALILVRKERLYFILVSGRFHIYEGYSAAESVYMIHLLHAIGVENLIITNAVGGVNPHYEEGELVMITDHINLFPDHPLRGKNHEALGPKFPDMSAAYDLGLRVIARKEANSIGLKLMEGIYFGWAGPSLETPAEYKMIHILGGDVVGMSTVPEVIVANYYGMKVLCFSVVSNVCFPPARIKVTTVEDVISVVTKSAGKLNRLILKICLHLN